MLAKKIIPIYRKILESSEESEVYTLAVERRRILASIVKDTDDYSYKRLILDIRILFSSIEAVAFGDEDGIVEVLSMWTILRETSGNVKYPDRENILTHRDVELLLFAFSGTFGSLDLHSEDGWYPPAALKQFDKKISQLASEVKYWLSDENSLEYDVDDSMYVIFEARDELEWALGAMEYFKFNFQGRVEWFDIAKYRGKLANLDKDLSKLIKKARVEKASIPFDRDMPKSFWWHYY